MDNYKLGVKVSWITVMINVVLAVIKVTSGILGNSNAMVADGIHTLSDVLTTFVVMLGLKVSSKEADEEHPYGHEKYESVFAKILSILLLLTGIYIGYESIKVLIGGQIQTPKLLALMAALLSIVTKEGMYWYTIRVAKKIKSISMEADAWHHRSDAFSSIGTLIGILGARLGFPALDPIAGIVVSIFVIKVGVELYIKSVKELVDESAGKEIIKEIEKKVRQIKGVRGIKGLKTRVFGNKIYVDIEILVDANISVLEGHEIAEMVHDKLEKDIEDIKHCMVHVEPF
ncbi:MAG: cation diffusion facilitator family transporter [Tissierellaceae bacterium]|nr:cation diffusion facilitator family transporter [Tissierellaceae bacterium]